METKKKRTDEATLEAAKRYVNEQLENMKMFGSTPQLSSAAYDALVRKVAEATK